MRSWRAPGAPAPSLHAEIAPHLPLSPALLPAERIVRHLRSEPRAHLLDDILGLKNSLVVFVGFLIWCCIRCFCARKVAPGTNVNSTRSEIVKLARSSAVRLCLTSTRSGTRRLLFT